MNHNPKPLQVTKYLFGAWLPWNDAAQKTIVGFYKIRETCTDTPGGKALFSTIPDMSG